MALVLALLAQPSVSQAFLAQLSLSGYSGALSEAYLVVGQAAAPPATYGDFTGTAGYWQVLIMGNLSILRAAGRNVVVGIEEYALTGASVGDPVYAGLVSSPVAPVSGDPLLVVSSPSLAGS